MATTNSGVLKSKEHYDLVAHFDKVFSGRRLDKESKDLWTKGHIYQDGEVNDLFLAFRQGFSYAKAVI